MPVSKPFVSIITINFNQPKVTSEFLHSLSRLSYSNYEVIVIDNGSTEKIDPTFVSKFPSVQFFSSPINLGFTGGNNVGIKIAKGDFYFIVNNDTEIADSNLLEKLIESFENDPTIGMVSPKIKYFDAPHLIQYAGYNRVNSLTGRNTLIGNLQNDSDQFSKPGYTNYVHGAAMMVRKKVAEQVGIFSNQFFLCYEELDWSAQAIKNNFKIFYQGEVSILHKESLSLGKKSTLKTYYNNRNRVLFMRRNTTSTKFFFFLIYFILISIPKNILSLMFKGQLAHAKAIIEAFVWNIKNGLKNGSIRMNTKLESVSLESIKRV